MISSKPKVLEQLIISKYSKPISEIVYKINEENISGTLIKRAVKFVEFFFPEEGI